jgi:hypothetical protein
MKMASVKRRPMKNEPAVTREMIITSPSINGQGSSEFAAQTPSKKRLRRHRGVRLQFRIPVLYRKAAACKTLW